MIPVAKPYLTEDEVNATRDVILSGWVTQGPKVAEFEEEFAHFVGAKFACATSSCTSALHLTLQSCGVRPGDVVITVSHSFIATANAIRFCGAEPVFIDIDLATYNMCPDSLRRFLTNQCDQRKDGLYFQNVSQLLAAEETPLNYVEQHIGRVSAILVVHQMGMPCDLQSILEIASEYDVPVIEDAACAAGSEISFDVGKTFEKIGRPHGHAACFSFHPRKVMTTGEGGMITTNDEDIWRKVKLLRHHGMDLSDVQRHESRLVQMEQYVTTAFNYRMTDVQAAMGLEQLKKLPALVERRRSIVGAYRKALADVDCLSLPEEGAGIHTNWQSCPVRVGEGAARTRDEIMQWLLDKDIATRPGIMNAHLEEPYQNKMWHLPNSETARAETIILPVYHTLSDKGIEFIVEQLKLAVS